jgi:hypothetical protein
MRNAKEPIDIEALLQRTFRDELPKGRPVSASAWDNIEHYCLLGTRVDLGAKGPRDPLGLTPGEPHADAKLVARAVGRLSNDQSFGDIEHLRALMREFDVQVVGDNGAPTFVNHLLPPGGLIERKLFALTYQVQSAVIAHAVQASRPIHNVGTLAPRPVIGQKTRGQPTLIGTSKGNGRYSPGSFVPMEFRHPSIEQFVFARASYRVWLDALHSLAQELCGKLEDHEPLAPAAPREPWKAGEPPTARIIPSLLPAARPTPMQRVRAGRPARSYRLGQAVPAAA